MFSLLHIMGPLCELVCFFYLDPVYVSLFLFEKKQNNTAKQKQKKSTSFLWDPNNVISIPSVIFSTIIPSLCSSISMFSEGPWAQVTQIFLWSQDFPMLLSGVTFSLFFCDNVPCAGLLLGSVSMSFPSGALFPQKC